MGYSRERSSFDLLGKPLFLLSQTELWMVDESNKTLRDANCMHPSPFRNPWTQHFYRVPCATTEWLKSSRLCLCAQIIREHLSEVIILTEDPKKHLDVSLIPISCLKKHWELRWERSSGPVAIRVKSLQRVCVEVVIYIDWGKDFTPQSVFEETHGHFRLVAMVWMFVLSPEFTLEFTLESWWLMWWCLEVGF